ncbi:MAG: hypothetical protein ACLQDY_17290, partial [Streptosporangiaceae bacterium]
AGQQRREQGDREKHAPPLTRSAAANLSAGCRLAQRWLRTRSALISRASVLTQKGRMSCR